MGAKRQVQEAVARCVATMVFYHNCDRPREARELMIAEVQVTAGFIAELGLGPARTDRHILRPVEAELVARYGHEVGTRLHLEFVEAFDVIHRDAPECPGLRPKRLRWHRRH